MNRKTTLFAVLVSALAISYLFAANAQAETGDISFKPCGDRPGAECGTLTVPVDWSEPDGETLELHLTRRTATDPDSRVGTLFYNPGGPGTGAAAYVRDYAEATFSPTLRERFDLIGIDPRGVGGSRQITCDKPVHDPEVRQFPRDEADYRRLVEHNRDLADSCDPLIEHVDTQSVARDFDAVRAALGEETTSYLGQSYGSILGTAYAQQFPQRLRAMSLDGVVDHSLDSQTLAVEGAAAVEESFEDFAAWCRDAKDCALNGRDVGEVWDALVAKAETEPVPVPEGRALTAEELRFTGYAYLNLVPEFAPQFATAIAKAETGDGGDFAAIRAEALDNPASSASYRAVMCQDIDPGIGGYRELRDRADLVRQAAPHLGGTSEFWAVTAGCLDWPIPPANPQAPIDIDDAPPLLLVGNTGDPATPVEWAHSLSKHIAGSRVLTYDGAGHTAYLRSTCATERVDAYLVDGTLPEADVVCTE